MPTWEETQKSIEDQRFQPDKFIMHEQTYRNLFLSDKYLQWYQKTTWLERFVAWLFCFETIQYEDFADQIEENIRKIRERQANERSDLFYRILRKERE